MFMTFHFRPLAALAVFVLGACANGSPGPLQDGMPNTRMGEGDPDALAGDYLQGRFAASLQDYDRAADAFGRAADKRGAPVLTASAFRYALAAGDIEAAKGYAETMSAASQAALPPSDHGDVPTATGFLEDDLPRLTLMASAYAERRPEAVLAAGDASFNSTLGQSIAYLLNGWAIYETQGPEAGRAHLQNVPEGAFAGFAPLHLALMFDLEGQNEPAEIAFAQALDAPGQDLAVVAYAGFAERTKSAEEARELYHRLSEDRGFVRRVGRMGLARLDDPLENETRQFIRVAKRAPLRLVETPREAAALAFLNFAWSAYEQAISRQEAAARVGFDDLTINLEVPLTLAQLAIAIDDDLGAAHYIVGAIARTSGRHEMAAESMARVDAQSWLYNYAAIDRAEAYVQKGQEDRAIALINDYLEQDALAPDVMLTLADLLANDERTDEAVDAAGRAIEIANQLASDETRGDNLWRYYFARGAILSEADRWSEAEQDLVRAMELAPEEPLLLNYLGYSYVERGENLDRAFEMIEKALAARPNSGAITDSLGWAHYQRGNYEEAVRLLERAVVLEPGDDVITDHLGDAYWQVGRKTEARFEWRRVLEIDNLDEDLRRRVEAKLAGEPPAPGALVAEGNGQ
jgi:tetratricopeptide (TPR) repeat protein